MRVEIIGVPGSGKSTLAGLLSGSRSRLDLRTLDLQATWRTDGQKVHPQMRRWYRLVALASQPRLAVPLARVRPSSRQEIRWCLEVLRRDRLVRRLRPTGSHVVDEGPRHALLACMDRAERRLDPAPVLARLAPIDAIVHVTSSPLEALEGLRQRDDGHPLLSVTTEEALARLVDFQEGVDRLIAASEPAHVIHVHRDRLEDGVLAVSQFTKRRPDHPRR